MVSNQTAAMIRQWVGRFSSQTATIREAVRTVQPDGSVNRVMQTKAVVACRLITASAARSSGMAAISEQEQMREEYRLVLPVGTALSVDHSVIVDDIEYEVVRVLDDRTDAADVQAVVTRRRGDG